MASIISAGTTSATALNMSADTSGILQLAYNNGTIGLTINASGNYGFATTTVATNFRAQFLGTTGSNTGPASSGTTQSASAVLRLQAGGGFTATLDIGQGGGTGSWLQSCDTGNLATNYPLILNPNGGVVCIGTTSSLGARLAIYGTSGSTDSNIQITNPGYGTGCIGVNGTSSNFKIYNCYSSGTLGTGAGIDIDTSGNLLVGTTSALVTPSRIAVVFPGDTTWGIGFKSTYLTGSGQPCTFINSSNAVIGYIGTSGTATSYITSSDYRLKENIAPMTGALAKVQALNPVTYKWKSDGSDAEGFIAHELAEICPHAVSGEKDAVDADGNPVYQGIDTSFLVATLTAAIKELKAEIDALKAGA